ncbi:uncharacterized protein LOC144561725 isoform X3 [Carex rostrata]
MGKGSKTANEQVAVAPVVRRKEKSGNNEKRKAAEALEKTISAKRKKVDADVKKVQAPPPKEEESTSTEEDTYSESEEEEKVEAEVKMVQAPPPKEKEDTSTEEDTYSESEEEEKVDAEVKKVQAPPPKEEEHTSTEEDTYSESEEEEKVEAEVKNVQTPPPKEEESTSTEDAYSESEEEEVEAEVKKVQAPPSKEEESTSTKEDTYSESKEEEVSMQPKTPIGNQSEHGVTRIFVGNLPSKVDEDDIAALFKEAGEVIEVRLARWKQLKDDKSKGFCHVEFATEEAAKRALEMNQQEFMGCELRVQLAKPEKRRKDNSSIHKEEDEPKTHVGNQHEHGMATIFVANLPFTANEDEIAAFFKEAGEVIEVRLSRGYCHVEFATEEAAKRALEMKHEFMGRELILDMGIPNFSSTCRREKKSRIHMGEDENTAVMMKDTPSLDKSYGKAKSNENEPKTLVGNQNEDGMATIRVTNLPSIAIEHDIAAFFKEAGEVIEVRLPKNKDKSRGYCHVKFATEEAAKRALEMKHEFMGREIKLDMGTRKVSSTHRSGQGNRRKHGGGDRGRGGGDRGRGGGRGHGGDRGRGGGRGRGGHGGRGSTRY